MVCAAAECVCSKKSTCSCGAQPALQCNCSKSAEENVPPQADAACACGKRAKGQCTCGVNSEMCEAREGETDFTNFK